MVREDGRRSPCSLRNLYSPPRIFVPDAGKIDAGPAGYLDEVLLGDRLGQGTDRTHLRLTAGRPFTGSADERSVDN